jgi:hypothetical protein
VLASAGCPAGIAPTSYRNGAPGRVLSRPIVVLAGPPSPVRRTRRARRPTGYRNESKPPFLAAARNEVHEVTG